MRNWIVENTGRVKWSFDEAISETQPCRFELYNSSIERCYWGPWGLVELDLAFNYEKPQYYSSVFNLSATADDNGPEVIIDASTATAISAAPTATSINITCPSSGVPATPITSAMSQIEMIPTLAANITFTPYTGLYR